MSKESFSGNKRQSHSFNFFRIKNQIGRKSWRNLILTLGLGISVSVALYAAVLPNIGFETTETQKLSPLDSALTDFFGHSVDVSGSIMIAGAYYDDDNGENSGSATIFERQGQEWVETAKLLANDGAAYNYFGYAVAIDGNLAIIGAYNNAPVYPSVRAGAAYVFERQSDGSWVQQAKLIASDGDSYIDFAKSVAISGNTAVIGAARWNSAYVYERSPDGSWSETAKLKPGNGDFGYSVAIDGDRMVVGGLVESLTIESAKAFIYERQIDGTWLQTAEISGPGGIYPPVAFGRSVAVSGDTVIAGSNSGAAYIFEQQADETWLRTRKLSNPAGDYGNYFGRSVDIDGNLAVVGYASATSSGPGKAYIFEQQANGQWVFQLGLIQSDDEINAFGTALSINGDTVLAGASRSNGNSGAAYVFDVPLLPASSASLLDIGVLAEGYSHSAAYDASRDGGVVVGKTFLDGVDYAFQWTEADGVSTPISLPGTYTDSSANAVSSDGVTMAGTLWSYGGPYEA